VPQVFFVGVHYTWSLLMLAVRSTIILIGILSLGMDSVCVVCNYFLSQTMRCVFQGLNVDGSIKR
jgi:hypothetical protein